MLVILLVGTSCDEDKYLQEIPKDFLTPENSFTSKASFEAALGGLYDAKRTQFYSWTDNWSVYDLMGMDLDLAWVNNNAPGNYLEMFQWNTFNADSGFASKWWRFFYREIFKANSIIGRSESPLVTWSSEAEKNAIVAEARFLRAYYYRFLANMWGGVPLVLEETTGPKFDYTRATREAVYQQCKEDLTFATQWMPTVDEVPGGRAPRAAAYHILAEVNIQLGDYQEAIDAASAVIDGGNFALMTERFGRFKDFEWRGYDYTGPAEPWGDVYFDLFREGNFNRIDGNRETIWNVQFEFGIEAGAVGGGQDGRFGLERWWGGGAYWVPSSQSDINGVRNVYKDTLMGRNVGYGGATEYMLNQVWEFKDDFNRDIRNSKYNVQRTWYWNNPESEFFGTPVTAETIFDPGLMNTG
ncbi:MAG: RagB/SusD family nutrient uptake outer membrane protein, partial [Cyclobacterium sp.]|uniref:RagB/SusD family nutrient uptake outer membrane protein n=1 Tax=Cyclobacterium sp. TaxID=1966343 RepID=UPI003970C064